MINFVHTVWSPVASFPGDEARSPVANTPDTTSRQHVGGRGWLCICMVLADEEKAERAVQGIL